MEMIRHKDKPTQEIALGAVSLKDFEKKPGPAFMPEKRLALRCV
jgi:hypothetical protein